MNRVKIRRNKVQKSKHFIFGVVFAILSVTLVGLKSYALLTPTSPNPSDVQSGGIDGGMSHLLKFETAAHIPKLQLGVYYPLSHSDPFTTEHLRIRYGNDGLKCYQKNIGYMLDDQNKYISVLIEPDGPTPNDGGTYTAEYKIPLGNVCKKISSPVHENQKGYDKNNVFFGDYKLPKDLAKKDSLNIYAAKVTIRFSDAVPEVNTHDNKSNSVNFVVSSTGSKSKIGPLGGGSAQKFGLRSAYLGTTSSNPEAVADKPRDSEVAVQFGKPCNSNATTAEVALYDPDTDVFGTTYIWVTKNGSKLSYNDYTHTEFTKTGKANFDNANQRWISTGKSRDTSILRFVIDINATYKFHIKNPVDKDKQAPNANVLSLSIPYDSITPDFKCDEVDNEADPDPNIDIQPRTYSFYPNLNGKVTESNQPQTDFFKKATHNRHHEWDVYEVKFTKAPNPTQLSKNTNLDGCAVVQTAGPTINGSCKGIATGKDIPFSYNINRSNNTADPLGTHTCYVARVNRHPAPSDELIADIQAFVNDWNDYNSTSTNPSRWNDGYYRYKVIDYDKDGVPIGSHYVYVGSKKDFATEMDSYNKATIDPSPEYEYTSFACSISGIDPKVNVTSHDLKVGGEISASLRTIDAGNNSPDIQQKYGSWGEYGVLSNGDNHNYASGAAMDGGVNKDSLQAAWSALTFANINGFGSYYGGLLASKDQTADVDVGSGTALPQKLDWSGKKVIRYHGVLRIDGDQKYTNSATSISEIPRIVLIADDIIIGKNVTRIDPWLIAAGGEDGEGRISTCEHSTFPPFSGLGHTITDCSKPIVFNGPVIASKIFLYRTGGSGSTNDGGTGTSNAHTRANFSQAAETFNLRPDAFLSAYAGGGTQKPVAITDHIEELPPRF
jgi:hypothetical protein